MERKYGRIAAAIEFGAGTRSVNGRRRIDAIFHVMITGLVMGWVCSPYVVAQNRGDEPTGNSGVYLPADRALGRALERAKERLDTGEYQQALTFLQEILAREEDSFVDDSQDAAARIGLKATARRMIGELPPAGRDAFELLYGAAARRQLEAAVAAGDRAGLAQVVRQYFHTEAGYEAALVLAQMESDVGHPLAAAELYRELLESPRAVAQLDPQVSLLAAVNDYAAGNQSDAAAVLKSLSERQPRAAVEFGGDSQTLPVEQRDFVAWLTANVGRPDGSGIVDQDWLTSRGSVSGNTQRPGGGPHLRMRWQARVVNDPKVENYLSMRQRRSAERGNALLPAARPIVAGDVVLMRTPGNVVAIEWDSGKRIWETREEEGFSNDELLPVLSAADEVRDTGANTTNALERRVWEDGLAMSLASDGERVYTIRGGNVAPEEAELDFRLRVLGGITDSPISITNQLAAFDLATEGKLVWELDGGRTGPLAGAFFLGSPLAVDHTLFVLAEIRGAVYLLALEPATGRLQWQQRLLELEQGISLDIRRRMAGCTPSYSGGLLVCPTAAGVFVAVDAVRRELAWVYRYGGDTLTLDEYRLLLQQQSGNRVLSTANRWRDNVAVISEGRVYMTPPESQELHCLDLRTGSVIWKQPQGDALMIGAVDRNLVLLVGNQAVRAVQAASGAPAWQERVAAYPDGTRPVGMGYVSEGCFYLPLSSGAVMATDIESGAQVSLTNGESDVQLGNLICVRGSVISQSTLVVDKFEQIDAVQRRAEQALTRNGDDPHALRELAELKRASGDLSQAVDLLKKSYQLAPSDPVARDTLVEYLLAALKADYAGHRDDLPLVRELAANGPREAELLRIEARGLEAAGDYVAAWDAYPRAADALGDQNVELEMGPNYRVRSDRWLGARMLSVWTAASGDVRLELASRFATKARELDRGPSLTARSAFLDRYGMLPIANDVRLQYAARLVAERRQETAEIELLRLMNSPRAEMRASAVALLVKLQIDAGRYDTARTYSRMLLEPPASAITAEGLSGQQVIGQLSAASPDFAARMSETWPRGRVQSRVEASTGPNLAPANQRGATRSLSYRQLRIEQDPFARFRTEQWYLASDGRQIAVRKADGQDMIAFDPQSGDQGRRIDATLAHAARLGSLTFIAVGSRIQAYDSRQFSSSEQPLWEAQSLPSVPVGVPRVSGTVQPRPAFDVRSTRRRDANRQIATALGPATPWGVVFHDPSELRCVDPLTGDTLWSRGDVPRTAELFGDSEFVFAADAFNNEVMIIRMSDGELVDRRPLPARPWLMTTGRNVARLLPREPRRNLLRLAIEDIFAGTTVWSAGFEADAYVTVIDPDLIAVYERTGGFKVVDVASGKVVVDQKLEANPQAQSIYATCSGNTLILAVSIAVPPGRHQYVGYSGDFPLISGQVYAFDLASGQPSWPAPAYVEERGLVLAGPDDLPIVVFAEREARRDVGAGPMKLRMLCLDKTTGQSIFHNDDLLDVPPNGQFQIRALAAADSSAGPEREITIETTSQQIRLTLTNQPRPPEPPAREALIADREVEETGIRGAILRATGVLQEQQQQIQRQQRQGRGNRRGRAGN